ncbi:MAG: hypothetical protein EA397_16130 [Deltaproteobacteria bacterium]|nr:MAG: hypothetical protein EA397_16130 [Deltaproteobacteria bacterium]
MSSFHTSSAAVVALLALSACIETPVPCTVTGNADGSVTISCPDGTAETLFNGRDGIDGEDGDDGEAGSDGQSAFVSIVELDEGDENCANGGIAITYGLEGDDSDDLTTVYVCNGDEGRGAVIDVAILEEGHEECANGGVAVTYGYDDEDPSEHETVYVCNGIDGIDGLDMIFTVTDADEGDCPGGGITLSFGYDEDDLDSVTVCDGESGLSATFETEPVDADDDRCPAGNGGVEVFVGLEGDERVDMDSFVLCNAADGVDGESVFLEVIELEEGDSDCPAGGVEIRYGLDEDSATSMFVCNGEDSTTDLLIETHDEWPGENCPVGGYEIAIGFDTSDDGLIDEVVDRAFLCFDGPVDVEPELEPLVGSSVVYWAGPTYLQDQVRSGLRQLASERIIYLYEAETAVDALDQLSRDPDALVFFNQDGRMGHEVQPLEAELIERLRNWVESNGALFFSDEARTGELYPVLNTFVNEDAEFFNNYPRMFWNDGFPIENRSMWTPMREDYFGAYTLFGWGLNADTRVGGSSLCTPSIEFMPVSGTREPLEGEPEREPSVDVSCLVYSSSGRTLNAGFVSDITAHYPEDARFLSAIYLYLIIVGIDDELEPPPLDPEF